VSDIVVVISDEGTGKRQTAWSRAAYLRLTTHHRVVQFHPGSSLEMCNLKLESYLTVHIININYGTKSQIHTSPNKSHLT